MSILYGDARFVECLLRTHLVRPYLPCLAVWTFVLCAAAANPVRAEIPSITAETPRGQLAAAVQPAVEQHEIAGAVLMVANREKVLAVSTVGLADLAANQPMREDSLFWIASQSKPITATALMMLVDEGKVHVEDPVEKYLPEFKGQMVVAEKDENHRLLRKPVHPVTVGNVLSHTSGLPFASPIETPTLDRLPLRTAVRSYAMLDLLTEPGAKYSYANAGLNTIGRIIEVVSGMPYEEVLQKRLFDPLGMTDTTFWPNEAQVARLAKSYARDNPADGMHEIPVGQLQYPLGDRTTRFPVPAGGLFSTAADLTRFCQMIANRGELDGKRYLSEAAVHAMTTDQTGALKANYGYGWMTAGGLAGHGGAYSTDMKIDPRDGLVTVFLVQMTGRASAAGRADEAFQKAAEKQFGH